MAKHWAMDKRTDIYEQRRYEIAKDVMAALVASGLDHSPTVLAPMAVEHADALLKALAPEEGE